MPYSLKEHIAECYRRAEEFARLHKRAPNSEERDMFLITMQHFILLARGLERKLCKPQSPHARTEVKDGRRSDRKLKRARAA